jgi:ABC-2 type transport system ATP-binding protein
MEMIQSAEIALRVDNAHKFFGKASSLSWLPWKNGKESENGDGNKSITIAVDHLSFDVQRGEIFGILGPNGGGKSTLIRLIATLLIPDEGNIKVFGHDVVKDPMPAQRMINRVSVEASFFKKLSPM